MYAHIGIQVLCRYNIGTIQDNSAPKAPKIWDFKKNFDPFWTPRGGGVRPHKKLGGASEGGPEGQNVGGVLQKVGGVLGVLGGSGRGQAPPSHTTVILLS